MAAVSEMVSVARRIKPDMSCLVPEKREELTTEGGLDVAGHREKMLRTVGELNEAGITVSLFIDAENDQIDASKEVGADYIEIHTGPYSDAVTKEEEDREYEKIVKGIQYASSIGLRVNVGHGLHYTNTQRLVPVKEIEEFSIGHSIVARAVLVGMERAVREMLAIIEN
jgi:pyridoxine 5-phosphate synthase